jgi:Polyketide cyclase / dehydrase and lipid transport
MRYADGPVAEATVHVAASPEALWPLVSDIHLVASLSTEVQEVAWLDPNQEPALGAAFRGRSRHPAVGEWTTTSRVVLYEPPRLFAWAVEDRENPTAMWMFELTPRDGGTDLRQWARMGPGPSNLNLAIAAMPHKEERIVAGRLSEWQAAIAANLAALKEMAERSSGGHRA